jgi:phosphoribosylformimino-5-aminoimidazole carboxamide ribotide isomerase
VIVYPAIDIRQGRCVRLVEGDFDRETAFDADPVEAAKRWAYAGAEWLHVVDLDGAVAGKPVNDAIVDRIVSAVEIPVQLGGGLRSAAHVAAALERGVARVVVGTAAIREPGLVAVLTATYGDRIAVGLDARDGKLAAAGWLDQTDLRAVDVARRLHAAGVRHFICTDIRRDGTLIGPNLGALDELIAIAGHAVIASGGIGGPDDVDAVRDLGAGGVIVGRALYDGRFDLTGAIARANQGVSVG